MILYSTNCPKCKVLESKLLEAGISFETCTDIDKMIELGLQTAPVLQINDKMLAFKEALDWIKGV